MEQESAQRLIGPSVPRPDAELVLDGPMIQWSDDPMVKALAMYQKEKELAMSSGNLAKSYIIEINRVILFLVARSRKNAGGENAG